MLILGTVWILAGCGGEQGQILRSGDVSVLVAPKDGGAVGGAGYPGGTVTLSGRCLGLDGRTVLWPHGTRILSARPLTVDVPGLGTLTVGDRVTGGGEAQWSLKHLPKGIDSIPSGCPEDVIEYYPES